MEDKMPSPKTTVEITYDKQSDFLKETLSDIVDSRFDANFGVYKFVDDIGNTYIRRSLNVIGVDILVDTYEDDDPMDAYVDDEYLSQEEWDEIMDGTRGL